MTFENWLGFSTVALLATLIPGPAMLLVVTHSLSYGVTRTLATIAGNLCGLMVLSSLSILGLSALVLLSSTAFAVIKLLGAIYLVFLGMKIITKGIPSLKASPRKGASHVFTLFFQGLTVALSNPKAIVFTTALFPQFIVQNAALLQQFLILAGTLVTLSASCLLACAFLVKLPINFGFHDRIHQYVTKIFGGVFVVLGVSLAKSA